MYALRRIDFSTFYGSISPDGVATQQNILQNEVNLVFISKFKSKSML